MITLSSEVCLRSVAMSHSLTPNFLTGGTSGSVLASRLSEDPNVSVLVLEKGPLADSWASRIPLLGASSRRNDYLGVTWRSVPQQHADDRSIPIIRGEALGGASRINGALYTRGMSPSRQGFHKSQLNNKQAHPATTIAGRNSGMLVGDTRLSKHTLSSPRALKLTSSRNLGGRKVRLALIRQSFCVRMCHTLGRWKNKKGTVPFRTALQ